MRIAIEEGVVPASALTGFEELGYSLWYLPRSEAAETARLVREFPPDLVILPIEPRTAEAARMVRDASTTVRILVVAEATQGLEIQPDWADLVIPRTSDPILWMLSVLSLREVNPDTEPGASGWRTTLLRVIENTHRAFKSMQGKEPSDQMMGEIRNRLETSFELLLRILLDRLERDIPGFAGHSSRVSVLGKRVAKSMGLPDDQAEVVSLAGLLHDLGMHLVLPTKSLQRPGPLEAGEWEVVRSHPIASAAVVSPLLHGTADLAIREHHERLDGSGYPFSKRGDQISMEARIVTVADAFQAMTHSRPHREAMSLDQAFEALMVEARAGKIDADVCAALPAAVGGS